MDISFLLGTFTSLVDRIINLQKAKLQSKKELFNEIIKPLFEELEPVASNYMDIFRKAKKLSASPKELMNIIMSIEEERYAMNLTRIKVREMADQLKKSINDEDVAHFADEIHNFFFDASTHQGSRSYQLLMHLVSGDTKGANFVEKLNQYVDENLIGLEKCWGEIVRRYEALKIHALSSPDLLKKNPTKK